MARQVPESEEWAKLQELYELFEELSLRRDHFWADAELVLAHYRWGQEDLDCWELETGPWGRRYPGLPPLERGRLAISAPASPVMRKRTGVWPPIGETGVDGDDSGEEGWLRVRPERERPEVPPEFRGLPWEPETGRARPAEESDAEWDWERTEDAKAAPETAAHAFPSPKGATKTLAVGEEIPRTPVAEARARQRARDTRERCWNCGSRQHFMPSCPQPRRKDFCYRCGRLGVTVKSCPDCGDRWRAQGPFIPGRGNTGGNPPTRRGGPPGIRQRDLEQRRERRPGARRSESLRAAEDGTAKKA